MATWQKGEVLMLIDVNITTRNLKKFILLFILGLYLIRAGTKTITAD